VATITLKNIPEQTYQAIKQLAAEHQRSINGEIIHLLQKATRSVRISPEEHLLAARDLRGKTASQPATNAFLDQLKNAGRP